MSLAPVTHDVCCGPIHMGCAGQELFEQAGCESGGGRVRQHAGPSAVVHLRGGFSEQAGDRPRPCLGHVQPSRS
eukprot:16450337-Heterocapsa_arctica.AAC.1